MNILFFDTETSGMHDFKAFSGAEHQPHLLQLAAIMTDEEGVEVSSFTSMVKPDGWTVEEEAFNVHGISTQKAFDCGLPIKPVLGIFREMCKNSMVLVAHNIKFDARVLEGEYIRSKMSLNMSNMDLVCTMNESTDLCKLPFSGGRRRSGKAFKWPTLTEAYKHFTGLDLEGAHDALNDVRACRDIFFAIANMEE